MNMWIIMTLLTLVLPALMLVFGYYFRKHTPKTMQVGYRTSRSMRSRETWVFAHRKLGALFCRMGWISLPLSVGGMLLVLHMDTDSVCTAGVLLCIAQSLLLIVAIVAIERALKESFDSDGRPRDAQTRAECWEDDADRTTPVEKG